MSEKMIGGFPVNEYHRRWRKAHPLWHRKTYAKSYSKMRQFIDSLKNKPCMDCGVQYPPCAMDFDHRDASTKKFGVGYSVTQHSQQVVLDEVAKCDLVCANCHRIRTQKRFEEKGLIYVREG